MFGKCVSNKKKILQSVVAWRILCCFYGLSKATILRSAPLGLARGPHHVTTAVCVSLVHFASAVQRSTARKYLPKPYVVLGWEIITTGSLLAVLYTAQSYLA
eukprot:2560620-Pleurochrysis_carterae.AAC.1